MTEDFWIRSWILIPTIENLKPVLSFAEGSKIENGLGILARRFHTRVGGAVAKAQQPTKVPRIGYLTSCLPFR